MFAARSGLLRRLAEKPQFLVAFQVVFVQAFTVIVFVVQAPLLGPRAFGIVALVMVVVGFCEAVVMAVAADTLISVREIDDLHFATATSVTAAISLLLGVAMYFSSGAAARLFGDDDLALVVKWMAILPLLSALWVAPNAKTKRDMQFKPTVMRSIASLAVGGVIGVALAFLGAGVWALVCQALLHRLVGAVALWSAVPLKFRLGFSRRHYAELRRIATPLLAARCMSWGSGQFPRLIIGAHLGTVDLGLYSLGARFADILVKLAIEPNTVIARLGLRRFAVTRGGLDEAVRSLLMQTSATCFPLCIGAAAIAPTLFHAWLGARWQGGLVSAQLLLLSCVPYVTFYCSTAVLLALNQRGAEALTASLMAVAIVAAVSVAASFGLNFASAALSGVLLILIPVPVVFIARRCGIPIRLVIGAQLPPFLAAVVMGSAVWLIAREIGAGLPSVILVPTLVAAGALIYLAVLGLLAPGFLEQQRRRLSSRSGGRTAAELPTSK